MNRIIAFSVLLSSCVNYALAQDNLALNRACYQSGSANYDNVAHLTTDGHNSTYWQSKAGNEEWIYVDLGSICDVNGVKISWGDGYASNYKLQVSTTGTKEKPASWKNVFSTTKGRGGDELAKFASVKAKYVRVLCLKSSTSIGYRIHEFEVSGIGAKAFVPVPLPAQLPDGMQYLTGGNWKLMQKSFVNDDGTQLSQPLYDDKNWIPATVPGTVLSSYLNIDAIPDPYFGDQLLMISEKFFTADFWYRTTLNIPESRKGELVWLNFDGINWKADVYFNGIFIGKVEGAFKQAAFDITPYLRTGSENALAVLIHINDNPGLVTEQHLKDPDANGGIIGLDSPTFLAAIGWNWMPTIRGRNTGIWNNVFLSSTGSEPLHILWRLDNNKIQVANNTLTDRGLMKAVVELYDLSGHLVYKQEVGKDVPANSITDFLTLLIPDSISKVHFIRLQLMDKNGNVVSRNFYWGSKQYQQYMDLNLMPQVEIEGEATISKSVEKSIISVQLHNESKQIGLMLRLKVKQLESGKRVLPAFYSDNYIPLVPGEKRSITIEFDTKFLDGEKPALLIEGWNIRPQEISIR